MSVVTVMLVTLMVLTLTMMAVLEDIVLVG